MIKITRFFYVHILVVPFLVLAFVTDALHTALMAYCVVTVHELFHLFAALLLRVRVKSVIVMPFGMTLRLSGALIRKPVQEIVIALAGPFANVLMLFLGAFFRHFYFWAEKSMFFYHGFNCAILFFNLLPILPLDGGRVLRALLAHSFGYLRALSFMRRLSQVFTVVLLCVGVICFFLLKGNFSFLMISAFFIFHMTEERKTTDLFVLKELIRSKEKLLEERLMNTRVLSAEHHVRAKSLLRRISYDSYCLIYVVDSSGRGTWVSEGKLVDALLEKGYGVRLKDIVG